VKECSPVDSCFNWRCVKSTWTAGWSVYSGPVTRWPTAMCPWRPVITPLITVSSTDSTRSFLSSSTVTLSHLLAVAGAPHRRCALCCDIYTFSSLHRGWQWCSPGGQAEASRRQNLWPWRWPWRSRPWRLGPVLEPELDVGQVYPWVGLGRVQCQKYLINIGLQFTPKKQIIRRV